MRNVKLFTLILALSACHELKESVSHESAFEPGRIHTDYQSYFRLIPSPEQAQVVYYVPTDGGILSENGKPRLSVRQTGNALRIAGAFKTGGYDKVLTSLRAELREQGFILAPAPVKSANADYLLAAHRLPSGRFAVQCDESGAIRSCKIWDERTGTYSLSTTDIRRFQATFPNSATVADRMFFNFELDAEPYRDVVQEFLDTGLEWDSVFIAKVDWLLNIQKTSAAKQLTVDWSRLAEGARTLVRDCQGSCSEQELVNWFQSTNNDSSASRQDLAFVFEHDIRSKLFVELLDRGAAPVADARYFTLRLAPEIENLGTQQLSWTVGTDERIPKSQEALYRVECLNGAVNEALAWAPTSPYCPI